MFFYTKGKVGQLPTVLEYKVKTKCNLPTSLIVKTTFSEQMKLVFCDETPLIGFSCDGESSLHDLQLSIVLLLLSVCECLFGSLIIVIDFCFCYIESLLFFSILLNHFAVTNSLT